ncbi:unnamed protein product [Effrenium voratum]|uniref:Uncharacterized protein n=1 Tax=Effrenium voratum TaxID=2562239 RepID=A0AA36HU33_9DINO|nr:unnamed protein product [Effrenium voratum]
MKPWLAGLLLNLAVVALFLLHLWPHLQVLFSDPLFEEIDYLIDPDPEPHDSDSLEDDTPVESGAFVLQREAELAEAEEHSLGTWKGPKHREMWTPGPLLGAALVVLVLFLNSAAPYAIRCYELQRQEDAKEPRTRLPQRRRKSGACEVLKLHACGSSKNRLVLID